MSSNITMPALSPTMETGNLVKWLVKEGDKVVSGDVIAEIETDKATMEVESIEDGIIGKILVPAGSEAVKVNSVLAILVSEGEAVPDAPTETPKETPKESAPPPAPKPTESKPKESKTDRVFATPLARRLAEQSGIDLSTITGSGPKGRIIKSDISTSPTSTGTSTSSVPHDGMRKVIAQRLTESVQTVPAYYVSMECCLDTLLSLRVTMNESAPKDESGKPLYRISVNDFMVKALAMALQSVPKANVTWTDTARLYHPHSDIGVAVAVDDGLFTPVLRNVESLSLSSISSQIKELAAKARSKRLTPEEYQGGTSTISNLGMFGVSSFTSIINPPHSSIVSIGSGLKKPIVIDDELKIGTLMDATFAFDHRSIDGALGAELAKMFKHYVEEPALMLV